jgi:hypothetical protein
MRIINALKISIPIMFERIGCTSDEYTKELGEGFVSEEDIISYKTPHSYQRPHFL